MKYRSLRALALVSVLSMTPALGALGAPVTGDKDESLRIDSSWLEALEWRSIGPASMGGRCIAIAVSAQDKNTYWIATASGGLLKTTNAGATYEHQFDQESSVSIGHVAVAPSNPEIVWVGTGEANPRNSVSYGDGVYKSEDGGSSWKRMGLEETFQTGRIAIHPEDPDTVYVGSLGRLYGSNEERGLFKTSDGGKTWDKVLYIDDKTGVIDVDMHPTNPDVLVVATYERERDGFDTNTPMKAWGPGSALYRTKDAGATWEKLTKGLPEAELGRIGVDYSRQNPNVLFAVIESERGGSLPEDVAFMGMSGEDAEVGARITRVTKEGPADAAGFLDKDIVISMGGERVLGYEDLLANIRGRKGGESAKVEVVREKELIELEVEFDVYEDGSSGLKPFGAFLGGQQENIQDQQGAHGVHTGGIYKSTDGGDSWVKVNSLNPRPMYYSQLRVDPTDENRIYVLGTSFWISEDGGANFERQRFHSGVHVDHHALWIDPENGKHLILGNDGGIYVTHDRTKQWDHHSHVAIGQFYHVTTDHAELYKVYGGLQDNGSWGAPNRTRGFEGTVNSDWFNIGGGDGFVCRVDPEDVDQLYSESQGGAIGWRNVRTGERGSMRPSGGSYRFNWETPFLLSHHNSKVVYSAGNHVFRSLNRGANAESISPEITLTDKGSATALAQSHQQADQLWVGTDDGGLWMTRDGGDNWIDLRASLPKDGLLDAKERREILLGQLFAGHDPDEDGQTQRKDVPEALRTAFDLADLDQDGVLQSSEVAALSGVPEEAPRDVLDGTWKLKVDGDAVPPVGLEFEIVLTSSGDESRSGKLDGKEQKGKLRRLKFDPETKDLSFEYKCPDALIAFSGSVQKESITGEITIAAGEFKASFKGEREALKEKKPKTHKQKGPSFAELMPKPMWITGIEASRHKAGRVYVAVDGHRSDDDKAYAFVSEDEGFSWTLLTEKLPRGSVRCLREDLHNPDLLYLGTEFNGWVSADRGQNWSKLAGLPTVAVHEFAQSPATGDVVVGTHGRSLWTFDASQLRQLTKQVAEADAVLLAPAKVTRWGSFPSPATSGTRRFVGDNPSRNAEISYSLNARVKDLKLEILGAGGEVLHTFAELEDKSGLHKVSWNMRQSSDGEVSTSGRRRRGGRQVPLGTYTVRMSANGLVSTQPLVIQGDPDFPELTRSRELEQEEEGEEEEHPVQPYLGDH